MASFLASLAEVPSTGDSGVEQPAVGVQAVTQAATASSSSGNSGGVEQLAASKGFGNAEAGLLSTSDAAGTDMSDLMLLNDAINAGALAARLGEITTCPIYGLKVKYHMSEIVRTGSCALALVHSKASTSCVATGDHCHLTTSHVVDAGIPGDRSYEITGRCSITDVPSYSLTPLRRGSRTCMALVQVTACTDAGFVVGKVMRIKEKDTQQVLELFSKLRTRSESLGRLARNTGSMGALPEVPTGSGVAQPVAEASCCVMVKSIDMPWCDDVAAGLKFFECVANRVRFVNQFKRLQAGDLFVVLRTRDAKRVTAVAQVQSRQLERQTDRTLLTQHLQDGRHKALMDFLGDAPTFNVVFFDKVYDCKTLSLNLSALVAKVPGLQEPPSLNGPGFLTDSREGRDALLKFLDGCGCAVRYTHAPQVAQSRYSPY